MSRTNDLSNSYIINNFSESLRRLDFVTTIDTTVNTGEKTITFTNHFGTSNIDTGDVLRISDGVTTVDYTLVHPMVYSNPEYPISASVASGSNTFQAITGTIGHSGGAFSPDGTKLAVKTGRHGGAVVTDEGIDIYTSASGTGWTRTDSIDTGLEPIQVVRWYSNSELWAHESNNNKIYSFTSGAVGFAAATTKVGGNGGYDTFNFNPSKTLLVAWDDRQTSVKIWSSASGNWTSDSARTISLPGGSGVEIEGVAWINDDTIALGMPTYSTTGRIEIWQTADGGSTWSEIESLDGGPGDAIGSALYYQTSSGNMLVGDGRDTNATNDLYMISSSSAEGFLPNDWAASKTLITGSLRRIMGMMIEPSPSDDAVVCMVTAHESAPYDEGVLFAAESGSAGWKATVIDSAVAAIPIPSKWGTQIAVSPTMIAFNDDSRPIDEVAGTADFKIHYNFGQFGQSVGSITGGDAAGATDIGGGADRSATLVVDEFITKIGASALDVTLVDNGGSSTNASFKISPGAGKVLTITEDPSGNGEFGLTSGFTTVSEVTSGGTTTISLAPFRLMTHGATNVHEQKTQTGYESFLGDQKL